MADPAGSALDASALLAYLQDEPGAELVEEVLAAGAVMSTVNYAEVLSRLADAGEPPEAADRQMRERGLIGGLIAIIPLTEADAIAIAQLRPVTRVHGLSLGDRACLATGLRLQRPVLTADRSWAGLALGVAVRLIPA